MCQGLNETYSNFSFPFPCLVAVYFSFLNNFITVKCAKRYGCKKLYEVTVSLHVEFITVEGLTYVDSCMNVHVMTGKVE